MFWNRLRNLPQEGKLKQQDNKVSESIISSIKIINVKSAVMRAKFEEKTYENYFNSELAGKSSVYFPLGQVQEGSLGFDSSVMSRNRSLWKLLGYPFWFNPAFSGLPLREIADEMESLLRSTLDKIPKIKANLLFQYKKPAYITAANGSEWKHWKKPYYRYDIYKEQHNLLMHIDDVFGSKILILYASPALHDVDDLVDAYLNKKIISISNFRKVSELAQHHRNTYIKSGTFSIACSKPERIANFDLIELIENLSLDSYKEYESNQSIIVNFREQLLAVVSQSPYYADSFSKLNNIYSEFAKYELLYSHLILSNFRQITGLQWLAKVDQF